MNILKKLFNKKLKVLDNQKTFIKKNIGNIKIFDDVKIKVEDDLFDGWVYGNKSNVVYVVYTDNSKDKDGNIRVFASIYEVTDKGNKLLPIKSEKEWKVIETILKSIQEETQKAGE